MPTSAASIVCKASRAALGAALLALSPASAAGAEVPDAMPVRVLVSSPQPGEVVRGRIDMAPLQGSAVAGERPTQFDVMLVLDVSGSTKYPSGIDVDEDGELGESQSALVPGTPDTINTDPDDSVFAASIKAGKALLDGLEPSRVRIGLVTFSGEIDPKSLMRRSPTQTDAWLEQPLTSDFAQVQAALEAVYRRGPTGATNMEAGVKLALRELAGLSGAASQPRPGAKRVILFLTDGKPSLPFGKGNVEDQADIEATVAAAQLSRAAGITLNVYGLGPEAIDYPIAATEMARATGGLYTPVRRPGDIVALLTGVSFANIDDVVAVNTTTGEMAGPNDIELRPDGSFQGFVPVRAGRNVIRVSALASDGSRGSQEIEIQFQPQDLTDAERAAELERIRKRTRELSLLMERKRQEQFRKEIEKSLKIEVEDGKEAPSSR
jgi:Mg-chelatase subunit ChlD